MFQGSTIGGGAELSLGCDFRLLSESAKLSFIHSRVGLVPGWGGGTRLVRLLGLTTALQLLSTGQKLTAEEAVRIGLVSGIVSDADPVTEATAWLLEHVKPAAEIVRTMKGIVSAASELPMIESLDAERKLFVPIFGGSTNKLRSGKVLKETTDS